MLYYAIVLYYAILNILQDMLAIERRVSKIFANIVKEIKFVLFIICYNISYRGHFTRATLVNG